MPTFRYLVQHIEEWFLLLAIRNLLFFVAPLPIVTGSMWLSDRARDDPTECATRNEVRVVASSLSDFRTPPPRPWMSGDLEDRCTTVGRRLASRLGPSNSVIVRRPFVLGGNLGDKQLDRWHRETIVPAVESMTRDYFRVSPDHPVTILMFSDEATYRKHAWKLFGHRQVSIYGFYQPMTRTVVINLGAGGGTLVHELTHALLDFDFPDVPVWFNEGLASYHEHCELVYEPEGPVIHPYMNWRLKILQDSIRENRLRPTWELMQVDRLRGRDEAVHYAHARYFCYYLAEHGLLQPYYRALRESQASDPHGDQVARQFFPGRTWAQVENDFRHWVMRQTLEAS